MTTTIYRRNIDSTQRKAEIAQRKLFFQLFRCAQDNTARGVRQLIVFSNDFVGAHINVFGVFEKNELDILFSWLQQDHPTALTGVALDVGANIGNHAVAFRKYYSKVVCFEPAPKTYRVLLLNTEDDRQITCHKYGLSSENKTARMISYENNIGHATVVNDSFTSGCDIELRTLDSVLDAIISHDERIRLLKIDVEGHEYEALMGATTTISKHRPLILIEQLSAEIKDGSSKVIQLLRDMGYQKFATLGIRSRSVAVPWVKPKVNLLLSKLIPYKSRFLGTEKYVELCDFFKVADYPFIIALPEWLYERQ